jgi:hypothetical protein
VKPQVAQGQLKIDFDYDDRVERLAKEYELMLQPYVSPGTTRETTKNLAGRLAILAGKRLARHEEPREEIRCHGCDVATKHDERVRVVMCVRCAMAGGSPGSDG